MDVIVSISVFVQTENMFFGPKKPPAELTCAPSENRRANTVRQRPLDNREAASASTAVVVFAAAAATAEVRAADVTDVPVDELNATDGREDCPNHFIIAARRNCIASRLRESKQGKRRNFVFFLNKLCDFYSIKSKFTFN